MTNKDSQEFALAFTKGLVSTIPVIGGLTAEILTFVIPNQRQERIEKLLNILASRVFNISEQELEKKFQSTDFIDIFEDVLLQSIRATSQERLEYLASVLEKGLKSEDFNHFQTKRLLEILSNINDIEVILLQYYSFSDIIMDSRGDNEKKNIFRQKHKNIFEDWKSNDSEKKAINNHYLDNLIALGLVGPLEFTPIRGLMLDNNTYLTNLGYMLLNLIGLEFEKNFVGIPINALDVSRNLLSKSQQIENQIETTKKGAIQEIKQTIKLSLDNFNREINRRAR